MWNTVGIPSRRGLLKYISWKTFNNERHPSKHETFKQCRVFVSNTGPSHACGDTFLKRDANVVLMLGIVFGNDVHYKHGTFTKSLCKYFFVSFNPLGAKHEDSLCGSVLSSGHIIVILDIYITSLSAQSWQYRDRRKPEAGTMNKICFKT